MSIQRMSCFFFNLGYSCFSRPKNDSSRDIWGTPFQRLTCGPTKLARTKGFVNLVKINDSSCSDRTLSIQRLSCFLNLWSSCSSCPKQRRLCHLLLPPVADCAAAEASPPPTIPTACQALRRRQPNTAAEPVNPCTPLHAGFHCRVFPSPARCCPVPRRRPPP